MNRNLNRVSRPIRCDGMPRREALRIGGLSAFGLGLGNLFHLRRAAASASCMPGALTGGKAKACVLIWLDGGPSHLETFDPKPEAPVEVRGPLQSIATSLPGIRLSECLPQTAKRMNQMAIIRSMTSTLGEHNFGTHYLLSGFRPSPALAYPSFHSVAASVFDKASMLPQNIAIPNGRMGGGSFSGNGFLPPAYGPFAVGGDPGKPGFQVRDLNLYDGLTLQRVEQRQRFVQALDRFSELGVDQNDPALDRAFRLVTSSDARNAFQIDQEPREVHARYGARSIGQSCLLARRLVERGVPLVTVNAGGWDTHDNLVTRLKDGYTGAKQPVGLIPSLDQALSALIDDLNDRRLLEETLIVVMGEFGRTPKLNPAGGRDHWPRAFSVALAGGGVRGGQVIGASDATGESPKDRPVTPSDLVATIYRLLGIDPELELKTADGRPVRITPFESRVIDELVG